MFVLIGEVKSTVSLALWTGPITYKLGISAFDNVHVDGPKTLMINIDNVIEAPVFVSLPGSTTVAEDATISARIFNVSISNKNKFLPSEVS